ncbi:MAG: hypothetical protein COA78_15720 [Blastopirellula sp.]|nr:MAG: hypothetical protein COA78_15720 [Blastopirellula sp.]
MAPAKKTYELGMAALDATIIAAGYTVDDAQGNPILDSNGNSSADHVAWEAKVKADYEEALNEPDDPEIEFEEGVTGSADDPMGANIRRNKDIAAAQTAQLQALGAAVVVHATTLGSAIVTRASGLGGAVTGLASDWATATSTFVQTIGGVISTLSSGLNSAESTSHSQIVSATEGFSGTVDPATSQNLTDTNTAILGYVTSTNASQYDYWEDQSSTQSTDLATRSTNNSSITEFQDAADKSSGSDSFLVNYRPDYLANGDTQITDLLSYGTSMFDVNSQLGSSAASGLNSYGTTALGKGHAWQSSAVGSGNEYGQKLSDAAGDYDTGSTGVSTTLGNTLAGNYAAYLTNVVQTEVDFALGDKTEAERDTELLAADNQQIADTADADLEYAEGIATEIKTNNVSNFQADAGYTKTMAGHDKTYANGVAEAGASLGTGMAIAITAGWTAETNAVNAANLAAAANTGERAKDWSGSQLVGVTTMDTNIGTPFSGYLKDKSTATSNAAVTQKTLAITKVLDENDARTLYNNMAVMQYLVMSASTGGAEAGLTTTAASSAAAASDAIAGSWESNGTDLAGAVDAYQKAEAALQRDHRVAVELANRSGGDASAVAALIAAADLALNDALPGLAATYFTAEIAADYGFQITEATEQRGHANNVGAAVVGATAAIGAARTGYAQAEADGNSAQQTSLANIDAAFKEDFQDASYDEAVLALTGSDPWTTKLLAEELAKQTLVSTVAPARATGLIALAAAQTTKEKADATSAETKANEQAVAAHDDMVNQWDAIVDDLTGKQEAEDGANDLFVAMSEGKENDNPATDVNEPGAIHNAYGDVESSSTTRSETKTPNIDDLASEGLKFRSPPQVGTTSRVDLLNLQHIGQSLQATSLSDIDLTSINDIFSKTKNNPTLQREVYIKLFADAYYNGDIDKATLDINKYVKALAYINTNPTLSNNAHLSFGSAASTNLIITQAAIDQAWEETFSIELTRAYYTLHPLDPAPLTSNGSVGPVINGSTLLESKLEKLLSRLNEIYEDRAKAVRPTDWLISGTAWYTVSLEEEQARLESSLKMWHRGYMGLVMGKTVWEEIKSTLMDVELQTAFIQLMGARVPVNQVSGKRITAPRRKDTGNTTAVKPINLSRAKIQSNEAGKKLVSNAVKGKWNEVARRSGDPLDVQSAYSGKPIKYRNGKAYIEEYKLDGVNFDRFKDGVLGDVKADYGFAARVGKYNPKLNAIQDLLNEAGRQIPVARKHGLPLEWHVRKQDFNFFKNVLNQRGYLDHITLVTY